MGNFIFGQKCIKCKRDLTILVKTDTCEDFPNCWEGKER